MWENRAGLLGRGVESRRGTIVVVEPFPHIGKAFAEARAAEAQINRSHGAPPWVRDRTRSTPRRGRGGKNFNSANLRIDADRFPLSPRVQRQKELLPKLDLEPAAAEGALFAAEGLGQQQHQAAEAPSAALIRKRKVALSQG